MRLRAVGAVLILLSAAPAYGVQSEWVKFSSPEGRFSVLLPQQPVADKITSPELTTYTYTTVGSGFGFVCTYADVPTTGPDLDVFLNAASEGMVPKAGAVKLNELKISLDGYPGRELELTLQHEGGPVVNERTRLYIVGKRFYSLSYLSRKELDPKVDAENSMEFFSSFKLTPE